MPDKETMRKSDKTPLINNKNDLIKIIEQLEQDNSVSFAAEEGDVFVVSWKIN